MLTEAEARENLDRRRAEFEAAEAARAELLAAVDAAYERQTEAEARYDRASSARKGVAANAAHAFADGDAGEPPPESRNFEEADAELDRAVSNTGLSSAPGTKPNAPSAPPSALWTPPRPISSRSMLPP